MRTLVLGLLGASLSVGPALAASERTEVYAIQGAKLVPVSSPSIEGTLVIRDGLIEALGEKVQPPLGARVIDGKGLVLTPGLIDAFNGLPRPTAKASHASAPLAPEASVLDRIKLQDVLKLRDSGFTTVLSVPREGVLPGQSALLELWGESADALVLRSPVALHLYMTTLHRKYPGSLMGTVAYVRQAFYDAARYQEEWAAYESSPKGKKRPAFNRSLAAYRDVLSGKEPLIITALRANDIRRGLALADEFKIRVAIAGATQAYRLADLVKARKLALLVSVNFDPARPASPAYEIDEEKEKKEVEEAQKNPAELYKAKVPFALVSGFSPDFLGGVRKVIESGLDREEALRALTLRAAEALSIADRTGSLEAGKIANVAVWTGEPLSKDAKLKMLFVDGHLYEPEPKEEKPKPQEEAGP